MDQKIAKRRKVHEANFLRNILVSVFLLLVVLGLLGFYILKGFDIKEKTYGRDRLLSNEKFEPSPLPERTAPKKATIEGLENAQEKMNYLKVE